MIIFLFLNIHMDKIAAQSSQNSVLTLKPSDQAAFKDFVVPKNMSTSANFLAQPKADEFKSEEDKKRNKIAKYSILGAVGLAVLSVAMSPRFLPKNFTRDFKKSASALIEPVKSKLNILNNITTTKDAYLKKIYEYIPPLKWLDNKSTKLYCDTAEKMTVSKFKKAFNFIGRADSEIEGILSKMEKNKIIEGKSVQEWIKEISEITQKRNKVMKESYGEGALGAFRSKVMSAVDKLDERFRERFGKEIFKDKDFGKLFNFTAQEMIEPDKVRLAEEFSQKASVINDSNKQIKGILGKLGIDADPIMQKADKQFNKAVKVQVDDYVDKMRDVAAGSAPTDITAIIASGGGLALYTAQAKTKEERTSVALTTGVPFGLGIVGTTIATMMMVSGFSALGVGIATTIISGIIGKSLDKNYKKNRGIEDEQPTIPTLKMPLKLEKNGIKQST